MAFNVKKEYAALMARSQKYATNISKMYSDAVNELLELASKVSTPQGEMFSFEANPKLAKQASDVLRRLQAATTAAIKKGIKLEWEKGNEAADKFLSTTFGKKVLNDPRFAGWTKRNGDALNAFLKSHTGGMVLSDKVWKTAKQLRDEMEIAISVSLGSGKSASTISREVRQYLREPDKLFRRARVGTDADGNPIYKLSEAAKAYHPGRGVYRSSYKNAMRLARTETNAAYRTADSERWQQMDFVTGIRISLSHSHPMPDICDTLAGDYPKDFKFTGWHPQCFCYATPITVSQEKFVEMQQAILNGETIDTSDQQIIDMPENFVNWCEQNRARIERAEKEHTLPYFIKDNMEIVKSSMFPNGQVDYSKVAEFFTDEEKAKFATDIDRIFVNKYNQIDDDTARSIVGASDLLGTTFAPKGDIVMASVKNIHPCQNGVNAKNVIKIADSIAEEGLKDAPTALKVGNDYYLLDGHHRVAAEMIAGKQKVQLRVAEISKEEWQEAFVKKLASDDNFKRGKELFAALKDVSDVDTLKLGEALKKGDLTAIKAETEKLSQIKSELTHLFYVDDGLAQAKQYGYQAIMGVEKSVTAKIDGWSSLTLEQQAAKLDFEANKYLGGNMIHKATGKPVQELYPTWKVSQKAYLKELAAVKDKIEWKSLNAEFSSLTTFNGGAGYDVLQIKASNAFAAGDKAAAKAAMSEMQEFQFVKAEGKKAVSFAYNNQKSSKLMGIADDYELAMHKGDLATAKKALADLHEWETIDVQWEGVVKTLDGFDGKYQKIIKTAYTDALEAGNYKQARSAVEEAKKWKDIIPAFKEAAAFKSKSPQYNQLVAEMQEAIDKGNLAAAKTKQAQIADKRALLDKKYGKVNKTNAEFQDSYSQERKNAALWDTEKGATMAGRQHGKLADDTLFNSASESWKAAIEKEKKAEVLIDRYKRGEITRAELEAIAKQQELPVYAYDNGFGVEFITQRQAMFEYTHHYCDVNEPLELRTYGCRQDIERFYAKANAMTDYLDTCATPKDMWFQRGDSDMSAVLGRLEFAGQADDSIRKVCGKYISDLKTSDLQVLVGKTMQEGGFMSAGSAKRKGFDEGWGKRVIINIFAPNGSRAMYAEHFSDFGNGAKSWRWDGSRQSTQFSQEFETIFQRGTKMRITKAEVGTYNGSNVVYLDVEIVGQEARNLSYVPKSKISS